MQAVLGDPGSGTAEKFIGQGSAVSADNLKFRAWPAHGRRQVGKQIEQPRIEVMNLPRQVVSKECIQRGESLRDVCLPIPVDNVQALPSMGMVKPEPQLVGDEVDAAEPEQTA